MSEFEELDDLDRRILQQLQDDASISNQALAEVVYASPPTCLRRVRRLVETGVIQKTVAIVDSDKVSLTITALIQVTLDQQTAEAFDAFEALLQNVDQVQQCYRIASGADFMLVVQVTDMVAYHEFVSHYLTAKHNIRNVRTFFSINRSKFSTKVINI